MKFRKHFDYDVKAASDAATVDPKTYGPSLTVQSMAEDADLNVLMARFGITGKMPENPRIPQYGDFTSVGDYRSALHAVSEALEGFMELPAQVRARFNNDPQMLLDFVADDRNMDEARRLGLLKEVPRDGYPRVGDPVQGAGPEDRGAGAPPAPGPGFDQGAAGGGSQAPQGRGAAPAGPQPPAGGPRRA